MDADEGSRVHFIVTQKDGQEQQSGTSTPELPTKVQKVSANFLHGLEVTAALPTETLAAKSDDSPSRSVDANAGPENDCVVAVARDSPRQLPSSSPPPNSLGGVDRRAVPILEDNGVDGDEASRPTDHPALTITTDAAEHIALGRTSGPSAENDRTETVLTECADETYNNVSNKGQTSQSTANVVSAKDDVANAGFDINGTQDPDIPLETAVKRSDVSGRETDDQANLESSSGIASDSTLPETTDALAESQSGPKAEVALTASSPVSPGGGSLEVSPWPAKVDIGTEIVQESSPDLKSEMSQGDVGGLAETATLLDSSAKESPTARRNEVVSTGPAGDGLHHAIATSEEPGDVGDTLFNSRVVVFDIKSGTRECHDQRTSFCDLLLDQETGYVSMLLRQGNEQVLLRHRVTSSMRLARSAECDRSYSWSGVNHPGSECFAVKFPSVETASNFATTIDALQAKMVDDGIPFFSRRFFPRPFAPNLGDEHKQENPDRSTAVEKSTTDRRANNDEHCISDPSVSQPNEVKKKAEDKDGLLPCQTWVASASGGVCLPNERRPPFFSCWKKSFESRTFTCSDDNGRAFASNSREDAEGTNDQTARYFTFGKTGPSSFTPWQNPFGSAKLAEPSARSPSPADTKYFEFGSSASVEGVTPKTFGGLSSQTRPDGSFGKRNTATDVGTSDNFTQMSNFGVSSVAPMFSSEFCGFRPAAIPAPSAETPAGLQAPATPNDPPVSENVSNPGSGTLGTPTNSAGRRDSHESPPDGHQSSPAVADVFVFSNGGGCRDASLDDWRAVPSTSKAPDLPAGGDANLSRTGFTFSLDSWDGLPKSTNSPKDGRQGLNGWKTKVRVGQRPRLRPPPPPVSDVEASVLRSLECPVCLDPCTPPIYTCLKGHHVCHACRPRIRVCGVCKGPMSTARNWLAEEISAKIVKLPCKNADGGCTKRLFLREMAKHLLICAYSVRCPCYEGAPCPWRGPLSQLESHATESHPIDPEDGTEPRPLRLRTSATRSLTRVGGQLFQCHMEFCHAAAGWYPLCRRLDNQVADTHTVCEFHLFTTYGDDAKRGPFSLTYANRVLGFAEDHRRLPPLVVNTTLVDGLVQSGHKVFFTARVVRE